MGDEWFGKRDPFTGEPRGDRDEYTSWDWALQNAFQTIQDYTDEKSGLLIWEMEDDNAYVNANKKYNKFQAAVDNKTKGTPNKPYKAEPGEYFTPHLKSHVHDDEGNPVFQTMRAWVERSIAEGGA